MLEVRHLRVLDAIRREGTVSKAAHRLHLTQPAVSHTLRDLRERLGVELFVRQGQQMVPTPEGERLLQSADVVLGEIERAEHDVEQLRGGFQGVVRIATECYTCYNWLPIILREFNDTFPLVEIQIVPEATGRPIAALLDGELDLAVVHHRPTAEGLVHKKLFPDEHVAVMTPDHPLASRPYLQAKDFADQHVILHTDFHNSDLYREVLAPSGVMPQRVSELRLTEAVLETVKARIGITVMAQWAVAPQLEAGDLCGVRITRKGLHRTWYTVVRERAARHPGLRELVRLLKQNGLSAARTCRLAS